MFDPSDQLHDYFVGQGYSDLEAYKLAAEVSGRCPVHLAHNKPERTPVSSAENKHMSETYDSPQDVPVGQDSEIIDLGFDVTEADVARPVIRNGTYDATIAFAREGKTAQKGLPQIEVGYRLAVPTKDLNGKEINPGFTIVQRILTKPTGDLTEKMIRDRLGRIHFAAAGPGRVTTGAWVGKPVRVRVGVREPHRDKNTGEEYEASNTVVGIYPPVKSAEADA